MEAARRFGVSRQWIYTLLSRYHAEGIAGLQARSRRPHSNPHQSSVTTTEQVLHLRAQLLTKGLDAGAQSIWDRMSLDDRPSISTIWRLLKASGQITPQPQKRPRSSWHRFQADAPNEMWQSDFTHWHTQDLEDVEIISWLDDHSRFLLHTSAHPRITASTVIDTFTSACHQHGYPQSTLTDNAMVYTTRLSRGAKGENRQPNGFEQLIHDLGIKQKNGAPSHPTTQGKIERWHQTLKKWLTAQPPAENIPHLQQQVDQFTHIYNTERPHRAIGRQTPLRCIHWRR